MGADRNDEGNVSGNVSPLSSTERVRRHRARKRLAKAARGPGRPFQAGNGAALRHGAYSPERVEALAGQIVADILARPSCPRHLREDPESYAELLELWGSAMAVCRLLRASLAAGDIRAAITELLEQEETETRPAPGAVTRSVRSWRTQAALDALHKHQSQAMQLAVRLGLDAASRARAGDGRKAVDLASYWAQQDAAERAGESSRAVQEFWSDPG